MLLMMATSCSLASSSCPTNHKLTWKRLLSGAQDMGDHVGGHTSGPGHPFGLNRGFGNSGEGFCVHTGPELTRRGDHFAFGGAQSV